MSVCIKDLIQNMNLVIGCTVGCPYCYARNNVKRFSLKSGRIPSKSILPGMLSSDKTGSQP